MSGQIFDFNQVTLVNESSSEILPGDISIFATPEMACSYLEPWWVTNHEGTVLTLNGDRLVLTGKKVVAVQRREAHPEGMQLVWLWLTSLAAAVQSARRDPEPLPETLQGLIAYVGFER